METIRLALVEDDPIIRESLKSYLSVNPAIDIQLVAVSMENFLTQVKAVSDLRLDLVLLDIGLPGMSGIDGIHHIRQRFPEADVVMLTTYEEDESIFQALCAGACSYISKRTSLAKVQEALFVVRRGGSYMSPSIARRIALHFLPKPTVTTSPLSLRQQEIVEALVDGLSYKMIADKLHISIDTVRDHIKRIYRALEVNSKAEVIRKSLNGEI